MAVVFGGIQLLLNLAPGIGWAVSTTLLPPLAAGIVLGCHTLDGGGRLELGHMFAGFGKRAASLFALGLVTAATNAVITIPVGLVTVFLAMAGSADPSEATGTGIFVLVLAIAIGYQVFAAVLFGQVWFTSALVALRGAGARHAIEWSLARSARNLAAMSLYSGLLSVLALLGSVLALAASVTAGALGVTSTVIAATVFAVGAGLLYLALAPGIAASGYVAYRDVFAEPQRPPG